MNGPRKNAQEKLETNLEAVGKSGGALVNKANQSRPRQQPANLDKDLMAEETGPENAAPAKGQQVRRRDKGK